MTTTLAVHHGRRLNELHRSIFEHAKKSLADAIEAGRLLIEQKAAVKGASGKWLQWLEKNVEFSHDTASNYVKLYEHRSEIEFRSVRNIAEAYRLIDRLLAGDAPIALEANSEPVEQSDFVSATEQNEGGSSLHLVPRTDQESTEESVETTEGDDDNMVHRVSKSRRVSVELSDPGVYVQRDCDRFVKRLCKTIQKRAQTPEERQELFTCALKEFEQLPAMLKKSFSILNQETASGATETVS